LKDNLRQGIMRIFWHSFFTVEEMERPKYIIVIGTSAGGANALNELVSQLNSQMDAAFFIVMHLSKTGISDYLVNRLSPLTDLSVEVAKDAMFIEKGKIYIAPPNEHLIIIKDQIVVGHGPEENRWRPSIDVLFRRQQPITLP
jgi:two-component system, chemotaxis family, protein-glutamate methylesterase/glutaminase